MVGYGHGRGRGGGNVTGVEQLGFGVGESMPTPVLQPPPLYPPLESRPIPLRSGPEEDYLVELRTDFIESMRDSPAYLLPQVVRSDIERYSDRYQTAPATKSKNGTLTLNPSYLPAELRPPVSKEKKSKKNGGNGIVIKKEVDINTRLEELEKKEGQQSEDEEEKEGNEKEAEEKDAEDRDEEELEDNEDLDEEMDDGTDYVNNYFDNGESYLDEEDDNLDDGPVY